MVTISDLKNIVIFSRMTDDLLEKTIPYIDLSTYKEEAVVFDENDSAQNFYMLKKGKILLKKSISPKITISMGAVKPGYSFGWSAIIAREPFTMMAQCAEDCEIYSINGEKVLEIFNSDPPMGYLFMQHLNKMMKNRLDRWEEQLMRALRDHPDFSKLIDD